MTLSPIPKVLSTFLKHKVKALLIGGQACILYGAAEFSRDIDLAIMVSPENLEELRKTLEELDAERVFYPVLSEEVLLRGHACHFRCQRKDVKGLRIDVIGAMRGVDSFQELWKRRQEIELPGIGKVRVIGLADLVKTKKTQRDKDWPMIRRLIEADIYNAPDDPPEDKIYFWLAECRTPELLVFLASKYPKIASTISTNRPLLYSVIQGNLEEVRTLLRDEEEREREADRCYWKPLRKELEKWRSRREP
jgi:hypothetical protein